MFTRFFAAHPVVALIYQIFVVIRLLAPGVAVAQSGPTVAVFDFGARGYNRDLGPGMSEMLVNALLDTGGVTVVERNQMNQVLQEQDIVLRGDVDSETGARVGEMVGAQYLIMGAVTRFKEKESGGFLGGSLKAGLVTAEVGFTLRIVDATTGVVVVSKSISKKVRKVGVGARATVFGVATSGSFISSKAMGEALEKALREAVEIILEELPRLSAASREARAEKSSPRLEGGCPVLSGDNVPRMMVVIPEVHIRRRIPDPAGETEIIRRFLEVGFYVVDQKQVEAIRDQERVLTAVNNPQVAASLGAEFGADIIVIGEAFSEFAGSRGGRVSARARVEARAIDTRTGRILAADGKHGSGADIAEFVAAKTALRKAGAELGDYFITQLCRRAPGASAEGSTMTIEVVLTNVNFKQFRSFAKMLSTLDAVRNVRKSLTGNVARMQVTMAGDTEDLAGEIMDVRLDGFQVEIVGFSGTKLDVKVLD